MKESDLLVLVILISVAFIPFAVGYDYDVSNVSLDDVQIYGELLSGSFLLSLFDAPVNLVFSSDLGEITLREVLASEGKYLPCEEYNCTGIYFAIDNGVKRASFSVSPYGNVYGLLFNGEDVLAEDFHMRVFSEFVDSSEIPFSIGVGRNYVWDYNVPSENLTNYRDINYGCFNPSAVLSNFVITSVDYGYCEKVNLTDSSAYYLGANISGTGVIDLIYTLIGGGVEIGNCLTTVSSAIFSEPVGCFVKLSEKQKSGQYSVCVRAQEGSSSSYQIKSENSGINCGSYGSSSNVADYSIFGITPLYSGAAGEISLGDEFSGSALDAINYYLLDVYGNDCSAGCVVPISFFGDNLDMSLLEIYYEYSSLAGVSRGDRVYSVLEDAYRTSFSEVLSFSSLGWFIDTYGNNSLEVFLVGDGTVNKILSSSFFVESVAFASSVYPTNPPAGIEVYFYADIEGDFIKTIWDFGDGSAKVESTNSFEKHQYSSVDEEFNITLEIIGVNSSISKEFTIVTSSPKNYINETILAKRTIFNSLMDSLSQIPVSLGGFVKQELRVDYIQNELSQIEISYAQALSSQEFLDIATRLGNLVVPKEVRLGEEKSGTLEFSHGNVDPSIVAKIVPVDYGQLAEYVNPIYAWQIRYVDSFVTKRKYKLISDNGQKEDLLVLYDIDLDSVSPDDAYFVIQAPLSSLHFNSGVVAKDVEEIATYIEISSGDSLSFSVFTEGKENLVMYISPSLEVLQLPVDISACHVNGFCDKGSGENSDNCPQDCKNTGTIILVMLLILVGFFVVYTLLQIWYVVRYETHLFKERILLFNLLAFINNSKLNGKSSSDIVSNLSKKGWRDEQISYALKKSEGKNTGMFEIIPIQKIVAYIERRKAERLKSQQVNAPTNMPVLRNFPSQKNIGSGRSDNFQNNQNKYKRL